MTRTILYLKKYNTNSDSGKLDYDNTIISFLIRDVWGFWRFYVLYTV